MAKLKDIASHHNIEMDVIDPPLFPNINQNEKTGNSLRRAWIEPVRNVETPSKQGFNTVGTAAINPVETLSKQGFNLNENPSSTLTKQSLNTVEDLRGNPLKIMSFLANSIDQEGSYTTKKISTTDIANNAEISKESVKTALKFLLKNEIIFRVKSYTGLYGWTVYRLDKTLIDDFIKQGLKRVKTRVISSSSYNKTTTTNNDESNFKQDVSMDWNFIDFSSLIDIGFGEQQLNQLYKAKKLTSEQIQESIYAFAYARKQPDVLKAIRTNHLNFLMGILMKGEPYLPPPGYKSPLDIAIQEDIERKKKKLALEAELNDLKFQEWYNFLTKEEKEKLFIQELTDEEKEVFFDKNARYMPEHVKENKRKEVLKPYFLNLANEA